MQLEEYQAIYNRTYSLYQIILNYMARDFRDARPDILMGQHGKMPCIDIADSYKVVRLYGVTGYEWEIIGVREDEWKTIDDRFDDSIRCADDTSVCLHIYQCYQRHLLGKFNKNVLPTLFK